MSSNTSTVDMAFRMGSGKRGRRLRRGMLGTFLIFAIMSTLFAGKAEYMILLPSAVTEAQTGELSTKHRNLNTKAGDSQVAPDVNATLVQTIDTSLFTPASPDPSGIAYLAESGNLLIADSEVDETTGAGYQGVNMWEITRAGVVVKTGTTLSWPILPLVKEPTGLSYDSASQTLFVSSDDTNRIYLVKRGLDETFGTADDVIGEILTLPIFGAGATDAEDPAFDPATGHLFFLNGQSTRCYRLDPVNGIFGDGDDTFTYFDFGTATATDAEAMDINHATGTLLIGTNGRRILEFTKDGTLIRTIIANGLPGLQNISGMSLAPASNGSGVWNYWIVDRAVDNDNTPTENDGKLFELAVAPIGNLPPVVDSVSIDNASPKTNDLLTASVTAHDEDGDPFTYSYQWLKNGSVIPGEISDSLDLSVAGNGDRGDGISVRVTASDAGAASSARTSAAATIVNSSPSLNLPDLSNFDNQTVIVSVATTDPDGDMLTYSAEGLPTGLTLDPVSGLITGTIALGASTNSPYAVQITVTEGSTTPPPPITLVQFKTANGATGSSITQVYNSQPTEGNLLIAFGRFGNSRTSTMPEGWVKVPTAPLSPSAVVYYKIAGPAEPASVTLTASGNTSDMSLTLFEYSGMSSDINAVLDGWATSTVPDLSLSITTGQVSVSQDNTLVIAGVHLGGTRTFSNVWDNGFSRVTSANRHSFASRLASTGQYSTTESWATGGSENIGTNGVSVIVSFKGAAGAAASVPTVDSFIWTVGPQLGPSASNVAVSGRVIDGAGRGIANAVVIAADEEGQRWIARTNAFGYYLLDGVPAGRSYFFSASAKRHSFTTRFINLTDEIAGMDFVSGI